jgi:hypothetical protein
MVLQNGTIQFGNASILEQLENSETSQVSSPKYIANLLRSYPDDVNLQTRVRESKLDLESFGNHLSRLCDMAPDIEGQLRKVDEASHAILQELSGPDLADVKRLHTSILLDELVSDEDWGRLESVATRMMDQNRTAFPIHAERYLAIALAHSTDEVKQRRAIEIFDKLIGLKNPKAEDYVNLMLLQVLRNDLEASSETFMQAWELFPSEHDRLRNIGREVAATTGDPRISRCIQMTG